MPVRRTHAAPAARLRRARRQGGGLGVDGWECRHASRCHCRCRVLPPAAAAAAAATANPLRGLGLQRACRPSPPARPCPATAAAPCAPPRRWRVTPRYGRRATCPRTETCSWSRAATARCCCTSIATQTSGVRCRAPGLPWRMAVAGCGRVWAVADRGAATATRCSVVPCIRAQPPPAPPPRSCCCAILLLVPQGD